MLYSDFSGDRGIPVQLVKQRMKRTAALHRLAMRASCFKRTMSLYLKLTVLATGVNILAERLGRVAEWFSRFQRDPAIIYSLLNVRERRRSCPA